MLEDLSPSAMLFPTGKFGSPDWLTSSRSRTIHGINEDISVFLDWFNTDVATTTGHPVVEADPHGAITGRRLRRTLAWHIVRRPGGTIAGATQYGHLLTQITHGYAKARELHQTGEKSQVAWSWPRRKPSARLRAVRP